METHQTMAVDSQPNLYGQVAVKTEPAERRVFSEERLSEWESVIIQNSQRGDFGPCVALKHPLSS